MSGSGQASVGQMLRDAREAQNVTLEDAAQRLRLMHRQVKAMEQDDFESLGQPVFARGFVRNYARLLGLAPESLLSRMDGAPAEPATVALAEASPPHSWLTSPWLILSLVGLLLVVAVPVAEGASAQAPSVMPLPPPSPAAAAAPVTPPVAASLAPPSAVVPPAASEAGVASPPAANVPATTEPAADAEGSVLHLEFGDTSWTEIKDAGGRMLLRQLNPAGSSADVRGQPPFDVVIGNASQVQVTYNGRHA
ncbi:MAG: DUF4115 domain-containing protein [Thiobacillus sp.]|nr:DUF4115 domain-containing protein [Thiobacillus sp.]